MRKIIYLIFITACVIACNEKDIEVRDDVTGPANATSEITLKNGMLVFPDTDVLLKVINGEVEIPSRLNFTSQNDIYNNILCEEEKFADATIDDENAPEHCSLYNENVKNGFLKITRLSDGNQFCDVNLYSPQYACVANKEGLFAVGNDIYQVTPEHFKMWKDGDINDCSLLKKALTTDHDMGILINSKTESNIVTRDVPLFTPADCDKIIMFQYASDLRYYFHVYDKVSGITRPPITSYNRNTYMKFVAQKKSGSKWVYATDANTEIDFQLNIHISETEELPYFYKRNFRGANHLFTFWIEEDPKYRLFWEIESLEEGGATYTTPYIFLRRYFISFRNIYDPLYKIVSGHVRRGGWTWNLDPNYTDCQEVSVIP